MRKPEVTSKRVAAIAGAILRKLSGFSAGRQVYIFVGETAVSFTDVGEIRSLAGTALTQSPDKSTAKPPIHKSKGVPASQIRKVAAKRKGKR